MKSSTALRTIRRQASELAHKSRVIEAALDHAWDQHVSIFKLHGTPTGNKEEWQTALLAKWVAIANEKTKK